MLDEESRKRLHEKGIKEMGIGSPAESTLLWTSAHTYREKRGPQPDPNAIAKSNINFIGSKHTRRTQKDAFPFADPAMQNAIWRGVDANTFFNNSPQKAVEALLGLRGGDNLLMFDMETLGTFKPDIRNGDALDWYTPTEIAMVHSRVNAKGGIDVMQGAQARLSLLVKPEQAIYDKLKALLGQVKTSQGRVWQQLSRDQRRSLSDLTLYAAEDPNQIFDFHNGVTSVKGQTRSLMPLQGSVLSDPTTIARMERGLTNLWTHGNDMVTLSTEVNNYMGRIRNQYGNVKMGGYNIHAFDMPVFKDFIDRNIAKHATDDHIKRSLDTLHSNVFNTPHVDVYSAINSLYTDSLDRFGMNKKLENLGKQFGVKKMMGDQYGQMSHFALYDAEATAHVFNALLTNPNKDLKTDMRTFIQNIQGGKQPGWDLGGVNLGNRLFAHTGLGGSEDRPHDAVYRLGDDNKFRLAYDIRDGGRSPAIYKNAEYSVFGMYKDILLSDGNKYHGLMLKNHDDGLFHFIARDNLDDLQNVFHRSFNVLGDGTVDPTAHEFTNRDRAMRHYSRMFSEEGGINLIERTYAALDAMKAGKSDIEVRRAGGYKFGNETHDGTPEFLRNLKHLSGRLEAERDFVMPFVQRLKVDANFKNKNGIDREAQGVALRQYRKILDAEFGANKTDTLVGGMGAIKLDIDGTDKYATLNSREALKGQLRLAVTDGHLGKHPGNYVVKSRLLSLINQVKAQGTPTDPKNYKRGISPTELNKLKRSVDALGDQESYHSIIDYLGNLLYDIRQQHGDMGLTTINIETPTQVVPSRLSAMKTALGEGKFSSLMDRAIENTLPFRGSGFKGSSFNINGNSLLADMLRSHDLSVQRIAEKSRIKGNSSIRGPKKATESLSDLANAFVAEDLEVALLYHGEKKGLVMAIANKKDAERIFKLSPNEIISGQQNKVALLNLGMVNKDGTVSLPGQERIARMTLLADQRSGGYRLGTGFDEMIDAIKMNRKNLIQMIKDGDAIGAQSWGNSIGRRAIEGLSLNNRARNYEDRDAFRSDVSAAARWARGGALDVSVLAEEWFTNKYKDNSIELQKVRDRSRQVRGKFVDGLNYGDRMQFQREVHDLAASKGLNLNAGSIKDTHVAQHLRATRSIQELTPFGFFNPMAREDILKSVNYLPLEKEAVRNSLRDGLKKSNPKMSLAQIEVEVERRMVRRFITDTAGAELAEEAERSVNYLNLRAAYMNDKQLADIMQTKGIKNHRVSTYDGMFLIADDIADSLTVKRDKAIRLEKDAKLEQPILDLFGEGFDYKTSMSVSTSKTLKEMGFRRDPATGKITVATLMREDMKNRKAFTYDDVQDDVRVKGWDAERQALILDKNEAFLDGFKGVTDMGDRVTAVRVPRQLLRDMGIESDVVLDPAKFSRRKFGVEPYKAISLVLDEATRQAGGTFDKGKFTVGKLHGQDTLEVVQNMMKEHFGVGDAVRIEDGKLVMNALHGHNGEELHLGQINNFLGAADKMLGTSFANGSIAYGNLGFGVANVYNWQNSFGVIDDSSEGIVRWGIKERNAVQSRINRTLGQDSNLSKWLGSHTAEAARAQNYNIEQYTQGLFRAVDTFKEGRDQGRRQGAGTNQVIIKTRGEIFDTENFLDTQGRNTGRLVDGNLEISMHAFNDLPVKTAHSQMFTPGDYANTIISSSDLQINKVMENGKIQDFDDFRLWMGRAKDKSKNIGDGTVLFELPDDSFNRRYVRFANTNINPNLSTVAVDKLQKSQMDIWRKTKEYQKNGTQDNRDALQWAVDDYHDNVAHTLTASRDGSISKRLLASKMDASGRFSIQSVNPLTSTYQESTAYVSEHRMLEMIRGEDGNIHKGVLNALNIDSSKFTTGDLLQKEVLDKIDSKGLYGFVGRYPTINEDTIQVMNVRVDKEMGINNREARMNAATALRLKADFDGDFLSTVLTHYKDGNSKKLHEEMGKIWTQDKRAMDEFSVGILEKLKSEAAQMGGQTTVGNLMTELSKPYEGLSGDMQKLHDTLMHPLKARTSALDGRETLEARLGKQYIGMIDNMREKMSVLSNQTYDILQEHNFLDAPQAARSKAVMSEFGRMFSQELISSKKFDIQDIRAKLPKDNNSDDKVLGMLNQRVDDLHALTEALQTPNVANIEKIKSLAPSVLGDSAKMTIKGADNSYTNVTMDEALDTLHKTWSYNGKGSRWLSNNSLSMYISDGMSMEKLASLTDGEGGHTIGRDALEQVASADPNRYGKVYAKAVGEHVTSVVHNAKVMADGGDNFSAMWRDSDTVATIGRSMFDVGANKTSDNVGAFKELVGGLAHGLVGSGGGGGGLGFGAIKAGMAAFGGIWATSAIMRGGPTPEQTTRNEDGQVQGVPIKGLMQQPTARVTPNQNGEQVNIAISAKHAQNMSHDQVAALVHGELSAMMPMQLNMNMNVNDNSQNINQQWLQGLVAQAMSGRVF